MKFRRFIWCALAALSLVACKEEDDTINEFANWQAVNDEYYSKLVAETQEKINAGDTSWELIKAYTKPSGGEYSPGYSDYVVVEKLEQGSGTTSPLLSDSAEVHYVGTLIPSLNYPQGYEFDRTYTGVFDPVVSSPAKFSLRGVVVGFSTAVQKMHRGDRWRVYIPYQLGYKSNATGSVPAYSTLIFDLRLEDFWKKEQGDRE